MDSQSITNIQLPTLGFGFPRCGCHNVVMFSTSGYSSSPATAIPPDKLYLHKFRKRTHNGPLSPSEFSCASATPARAETLRFTSTLSVSSPWTHGITTRGILKEIDRSWS
uniref:Uncharacterized protein n=1 Tax=Nelumbo nucifera TaxID=4432 RepID=A0A822YB60_NELNU|nr:TPA_asm: hypothetical protein HUJ06_031000 [Nelumbo nucifera]